MGSKFVVRQPIKNAESQVIGFEILYHGENQAYGDNALGKNANDFAAADTIYNFLTQNTAKSLRGSLNFMTFTTTLLMKKAPRLFEKSELVIQIDDNVIIHPLAMRLVQQYAKEGYKIAINEFQFAPRYLSLMDSIDYLKLNFESMSEQTLHNVVEIAHGMGKQCIASNVTSKELYDKAVAMQVDAMEGSFVAEKMATKAHTSGYLQSNFFRLMVAVTRPEPDMEEIERIISMDATLTYGILRMANVAVFSSRNRITSVRQAIMTLGIIQMKQWIYLLSASNAENEIDPASEEFLKTSFMRASFCSELMNYAKNMPISKSDAYLMGMFSTLNYLIDAPMEEILAEVPMDENIKRALLYHEGPCGALYDLVLSYERADWWKINGLAEALQIPTNLLTSLYFNCMEQVNTTWTELTCPGGYPRSLDDEEEEAVGDELLSSAPELPEEPDHAEAAPAEEAPKTEE